MFRESQRKRKRAREKLKRHGFNYQKRCRLMEYAGDCVFRIGGGDTLFGGLVRFERMHVYFINYTTYLMEPLIECVPKISYGTVRKVVQQCHNFRDPTSGSPFLRLPFLLKMTHLTAERRVMAIFYWAHVLGTSVNQSYKALKYIYKLIRVITPHAHIQVLELKLLSRSVDNTHKLLLRRYNFYSSAHVVIEHSHLEKWTRYSKMWVRNFSEI